MITLRNRLHSAILGWGMAIGLIGLPGITTAQEGTANPDLTRQQVATFDQFLDSHPGIARDLRENPSLVNNQEFVENHPQLQAFLTSHPELREELKETPAVFMQRERQFEKAENPRPNPNSDLTRQQVATFDQFLDSHPGIARDLQENPSLVNNQEFVENHPQLQAFLTSHPELREELKETPAVFMRRERGFEASENGMRNGNPDLTNQQLATFDRFLDHHKGIAKDLAENPSLVNDQKFVNQHKDLRAFLKNHPEVSEELKPNPSLVMRQETRFKQRDRDDRSHRDRDNKDKAKPKSKLERKESVEPRHLH